MKKTRAKVERQRSLGAKPNILAFDSDGSIRKTEGNGTALSDGLGELPDFIKPRKTKRITRALRGVDDAGAVFTSEPLMAFKYDPTLGREERVVVTVKTTFQVHKNDRQEEQRKRPNPDIFGREAARHYVQGLVVGFTLSHDRLDWSLAESEWAFSALEPYAVDAWGDKMALSGGNYVWLIDMDSGQIVPCRHPWLSQAHTAHFSGDGKRLLVASAGFDAVFEFDTRNGQVLWEWFAWEHGFDRSKLGHYVVRSPERREILTAAGEEVLLVDDPGKFDFGIATRMSPAHLNSACYDGDGKILVTLFHQGAGYIVDKATGEAREVVSNLVNPHKLARRKRGGYFISDTRRGKLVFVDDQYRCVREIALTGMPGVERPESLSEFLQNTTELKDDLFACIDIHRNTLWLVDVRRRRYRGIKFPVEWSMHDISSLTKRHQLRVRGLVGSAFGKIEASAREEKVIRHFSPDGREIKALRFDAHGRNKDLDVEM